MRNFQKTLSVFVFALLLTGVFTLGGCDKSSLDDAAPKVNLSTLESTVSGINPEYIKELQWLKSQGRISDETYVTNLTLISERKITPANNPQDINSLEVYTLGGDEIILRSDVQEDMKNFIPFKQARHRRNGFMSNGGAISVRVHNNVPPAWSTAITSAVNAWNALGYNITFNPYTASNTSPIAGQIDIGYTTSSSTIAPNIFASTTASTCTGCIDEITFINAFSSQTPTVSAKKWIMMHELGHALGLKHTDTGEGIDVFATITCGGLSSYTDAGSIMKNGALYNQSDSGFTPCDKTVIDFYW
jgi:hypothetical protein